MSIYSTSDQTICQSKTLSDQTTTKKSKTDFSVNFDSSPYGISRLDAALFYTEDFGWSVFPVPPGTKKSYKSEEYSGTPWGQTNNPDDIVRDWAKWSDANIGLPCGKDNSIFVVEIDTTNGHSANGFIALAELETHHGKLPDTLQSISPSGSIHYYFNYPDNIQIRNSASLVGIGIDVRGEGGMVVVPPSRKENKGYCWHNIVPIANAPPWLLELIVKKQHQEEEHHQTTSFISNGLNSIGKTHAALKAVRSWLDGTTTSNRSTAGDVRNKWLNVMSILKSEFPEGEAYQLALEFSASSRHFKGERQFRDQWKTIKTNYRQTLGTLYYWANQADPNWKAKWIYKQIFSSTNQKKGLNLK